ncbi:nitrogen regulatory protein P-II 2 [Inhella inkyongensis]|uniref:Nitrogen regulatory protein P-II 2 n=1 Tax=Inhella inkyongensis TaxID=392593 RepID=A0A840S8A6_9BURK|nr:transcriptional regulator [Inhella inkyongensis]MBB5205246.1 nitrogen regulatory protein P-II 2 [Inhella inkyongensis]
MIQKHPKTQLKIVAEAALEPRLLAELKRHHIQAWTVYEVRGAFPEGERAGDWEADRSIELRVICDPGVADAVAEAVLQRFAPHYSVLISFTEVQVIRPERY